MTCTFYGVKNFDEQLFCLFLVENKDSFAKLKKLKLNFQNAVSGMSFQTVRTLMDNSNIRHFENLFHIQLNNEEIQQLTDWSKSKNLILLPAFQAKNADSSWICCRQGRHDPIFPDLSSDELFSDSDTSSSSSSTSSSDSDSSISDFSHSDSDFPDSESDEFVEY
jgi:hypothetical protein